jgi:hypothetical protein
LFLLTCTWCRHAQLWIRVISETVVSSTTWRRIRAGPCATLHSHATRNWTCTPLWPITPSAMHYELIEKVIILWKRLIIIYWIIFELFLLLSLWRIHKHWYWNCSNLDIADLSCKPLSPFRPQHSQDRRLVVPDSYRSLF